jgi:hypothetical protein
MGPGASSEALAANGKTGWHKQVDRLSGASENNRATSSKPPVVIAYSRLPCMALSLSDT